MGTIPKNEKFLRTTDLFIVLPDLINLNDMLFTHQFWRQVTKREEESSLMQLKDEFRAYEALRREHDTQIVQIATEAGLRISPEQWSSLLYGDASHKSHMQSVIDKVRFMGEGYVMADLCLWTEFLQLLIFLF